MGLEIERKFLVCGLVPDELSSRSSITQGYISLDPVLRIRIEEWTNPNMIAITKAWLTLKGPNRGATRSEDEMQLTDLAAAQRLLASCKHQVTKTRSGVWHENQFWAIDRFTGPNQGLVIAEAEIPSEDHPLIVPPWAGAEITHDMKYANNNLAKEPYNTWTHR
jgi:adenylate cyclase